MNFILILITTLWASNETPVTYTAEELDEKTGYFVLLAAAPTACAAGSESTSCEKIIIYENGVESLHYLTVDNRENSEGNFDVNQVLQNPEAYEGEITTIDIATKVSVAAPYDSVVARFLKDQTIELKVRKDSQDYLKVFAP